MYTTMLLLAMTATTDSIDHGRRGCSGCYSSCYSSCYGGYGGGCYGGGCGGGYYGGGYRAGTGYYGGPMYYSSGGFYGTPMVGGSYGTPLLQGSTTDIRESFYQGPGSGASQVTVLLPNPDAEIWFDGSATTQRGMQRIFNTPPLETGNYVYNVKARWTEDGRTVNQDRRVEIRPGQPVLVDFRMNQTERVAPPRTPTQKSNTPPNDQ